MANTRGTTPLSPAARRLGVGAGLLLAWSAVGGIVSVQLGANTWSDAWGANATLAAPWPMVIVQLVAAHLAVLTVGRWAVAGSAVLLVGAFLSAISGFFDGQFARADLSAPYVVLQAALITTAAAVVVLSAFRLRELLHRAPRPAPHR
ncbi:hypothetical protein [Blastococcus sp. SYSU DS0533]